MPQIPRDLQRTLCMSRPEAARLFYGPDRFVRRTTAPGRVQKTQVTPRPGS